MKKPVREKSAIISHQDGVHDGSPTPLYYQIYIILRDKITSRVYPDGSFLPSEHELEKIFSVSRITAKRALDELASEGLVTRQRGKGTRVTFKGPFSSLVGDMHGLLEDLLTISKETDVVVLEFDYVPATHSTADALKIKTGDMVQKAVRVRTRKGVPLAYVTTYVPEAIGRTFTLEELKNNPLVALIERDGHQIASAHQTITASLADSAISKALELKVGSPLLKVIRVVLDENEMPVELITVYYRPDLYQIRLNLARAGDDTTNFWSTS